MGQPAEPIDLLVAKRIRQRRNALEISQQLMADRIEVSRQQYIKYENGSNRVSAAKLYEISRILETDLNYFFDAQAVEIESAETLADDERRVLRAYRRLLPEIKAKAPRLLQSLVS